MEKTFARLKMPVLLQVCFVCVVLFWANVHAAELAQPSIDSDTMLGLQEVLKNAGVPGWVFAVNGDISIAADEIILEDNTLREVKLPISMEDGLVKISSANFSALGGDFVMKLELPKDGLDFSAHVQFNNVVFPDTGRPTTKDTPTTTELLFGNAALLPNWLGRLNGLLVLKGNNVRFNQVNAHSFDAQIIFGQQDIESTFATVTDSGNANGKFSHAYGSKKTNIDLEGQSVALSLLPAAREYAKNIAVDFKVDIATEGSSPHEWVSHMNGDIIAEFGNGRINVQKLNKLSQDILSLTLTSLLPITLGSTSSRFDCGAIKLDVTNGLARSENSIALRTENLAVMGGGEINFANEQVALSLHPHARHTGKLNAKSAIKKITVAGPISDLQVKPHLGGIINQGISLTTKIATLSLSKIGIPILDWAAPADIACMKSLN